MDTDTNVLDHLPEKKREEVAKRIEAAWQEEDMDSACHGLEALAKEN